MVGPVPTAPQTFLQLLQTCDNFRLANAGETLVPWLLTPDAHAPAIGLLRPTIVAQLRVENAHATGPPPWEFCTHGGRETVAFAAHIATPAARTRVMRETCERWRDAGLWPDVVGPRKWRSELYPIYRDPFGPHDAPRDAGDERADRDAGEDARNFAFAMERAACALFGAVTYGVHMTIYEEEGERAACRVWVPTRARTKQTWPGYLDNSIAGGIPAGMGAFESLVKEATEEGSIAPDVTRAHARTVGSVSYFFRTGAGWLQPEVEYVYDLRVPSGVDQTPFAPKPLDGEVESFELLPLDEVVDRMRAGLFKPNTALVLLDFMIRHGHITPENEPDYQEIITRLHGRFEYESW